MIEHRTTDYATENGDIAVIKYYFHDNENAHKNRTSTRNQKIENLWSHFPKSCSGK